MICIQDDWQKVELLRGLDPTTVRYWLMQARFQKRISQRELARSSGYSGSLVGLFEAGHWYPRRTGGFVTLARLVEALGWDVDDLARVCAEEA